jgi:endonuclease/exonuclease/phosphatase family metal-dependent hydrolase
MSIKILTYNIHKGFNWNNTKLTIENLKKNFEVVHPDIVFLQEVVGENKKFEKKFKNWITNQFEYLADGLWSESAYSKHAIYDVKDHGNVILSKYPILQTQVFDISVNRYENRAILYVQLEIENKKVDCFCLHLNLLGKDRFKQYQLIKNIVKNTVHPESPIIIAGDFNDWNKKASHHLLDIQNIHDVYKKCHGNYAKTFPAMFPLLSLDRVYTRQFKVVSSEVLKSDEWTRISDHLPILSTLEFE